MRLVAQSLKVLQRLGASLKFTSYLHIIFLLLLLRPIKKILSGKLAISRLQLLSNSHFKW